jgi:hypothetical protein
MATLIKINEVKNIIKQFAEDEDMSTTRAIILDNIGDRTWALVFGWEDGFDKAEIDTPTERGENRICGKIAYIPNNSIMSEFSVDWIMPSMKGEVWDTDTSVRLEDSIISSLVKYWRDEWKTMRHLIKQGVLA